MATFNPHHNPSTVHTSKWGAWKVKRSPGSSHYYGDAVICLYILRKRKSRYTQLSQAKFHFSVNDFLHDDTRMKSIRGGEASSPLGEPCEPHRPPGPEQRRSGNFRCRLKERQGRRQASDEARPHTRRYRPGNAGRATSPPCCLPLPLPHTNSSLCLFSFFLFSV